MLSHLKSAFRLLQCIDVHKSPIPLNNVSLIIMERKAAIQEPVIGAIRAPAAQFMLDGSSGSHCGPPIGQHPVKIFRMYCPSPPPADPLVSAEPRVIEPTLAYKVDGSIWEIGSHISGDRLNESPKFPLVEPKFLFCASCLSNIDDRPSELQLIGSRCQWPRQNSNILHTIAGQE